MPAAHDFPIQITGSSHLRLNSSAEKYNATVIPGIQEHRKCVQLNPEKGYLIVIMSRNNSVIFIKLRRKRQGENETNKRSFQGHG